MRTKILSILLVFMTLTAAAVYASGGSASGGSTSPATGPVSMDYWLPIHPNAVQFIQTYAQNEAYAEACRRLNMKINFIHPAQGGEQESFNLMMASGDLPDMIQGAARYSGGVMKGVQDGVYIELSKVLQKGAPAYYGLINSSADMRREFYDESGEIGAFYTVLPYPPEPVWMRAIVRDDWLKEFNMQPPKTWAQYETFLTTVQQKKPGAAPLYLPLSSQAPAGVQAMYGGFNIFPGWFVTDGKVRHGNADPVLKDYLTLLNDWYNKGLISKDFPSVTQQQVWSLFDTAKVGMYWDSVDNSGSRTRNLDFAIQSCPLPRLTEDTKLHLTLNPSRRGGNETAIVATSKNQDAALRFLDYGYTAEGSMLFNFGIEGKMYNMVNGKPVYTDYVLNNPLYQTENTNYILRIHFAPKLRVSDLEANPSVVKSPESVAFRNQWSNDPNEDGSYFLPAISLTAAENTRRAEIMANVNTYTDEMIMKFIIGTEPLANFDKYMAQLNQYGMPEALAITQAAYDRYMQK
ncbi:MAG: extracellular solute-binding protein [Treponema sp.]|nr:extracellular solute-binding protein [Treponema sp.]